MDFTFYPQCGQAVFFSFITNIVQDKSMQTGGCSDFCLACIYVHRQLFDSSRMTTDVRDVYQVNTLLLISSFRNLSFIISYYMTNDHIPTSFDLYSRPYKIILARKGHNDMKLLEECLEVGEFYFGGG